MNFLTDEEEQALSASVSALMQAPPVFRNAAMLMLKCLSAELTATAEVCADPNGARAFELTSNLLWEIRQVIGAGAEEPSGKVVH